MDILKFENQEYFILFAFLPVLLLIFLRAVYVTGKRIKKLGHGQLIARMLSMRSSARPWLRFVLFALGFSSLIMAAVNPQIGFKTEEAHSKGIDIVIALDVSRSMLAEDIRPNRMDRAKHAVSRLIDQLENDRIGLVAFAGSAVTQVPITSDLDAARMILRTVNTETMQVQGTAIGSALERSIATFAKQDDKSRVIILVSDGENHQDDPIPVANRASDMGIIIHTVGIGTSQGAPVPVYRGGQLSGFLRDNEGNTVVSRFDEPMLRNIAQQTGGVFQTGTGPDLGLNNILEEIRLMEQQEYETTRFAEYESRFHYFIALALIFFLFEFLIFERKSKWLNKIKLFDIS
jgi:Ca-activated chloride channel family protein